VAKTQWLCPARNAICPRGSGKSKKGGSKSKAPTKIDSRTHPTDFKRNGWVPDNLEENPF